MFHAYQAPLEDSGLRRLLAAFALAVATVGALVGAAAFWASLPNGVEPREESVDVAFRPLPKIETPPAPAPKVQVKKPMRVKAAPAALMAPKEMPKAQAPEATVEQAVPEKFVAVGGTGDGSQAASDNAASAINLPENGVPPKAAPENMPPEFPESARRSGTEGLVVLKVVVLADGQVGPIVVLRGEEPFLSAAMQAVASWKYAPALVEGVATSVYRIVKIPFRLK
jgi:protein TonB